MRDDTSFIFLRIRHPDRSTLSSSSAASDVYKRQQAHTALRAEHEAALAVMQERGEDLEALRTSNARGKAVEMRLERELDGQRARAAEEEATRWELTASLHSAHASEQRAEAAARAARRRCSELEACRQELEAQQGITRAKAQEHGRAESTLRENVAALQARLQEAHAEQRLKEDVAAREESLQSELAALCAELDGAVAAQHSAEEAVGEQLQLVKALQLQLVRALEDANADRTSVAEIPALSEQVAEQQQLIRILQAKADSPAEDSTQVGAGKEAEVEALRERARELESMLAEPQEACKQHRECRAEARRLQARVLELEAQHAEQGARALRADSTPRGSTEMLALSEQGAEQQQLITILHAEADRTEEGSKPPDSAQRRGNVPRLVLQHSVQPVREEAGAHEAQMLALREELTEQQQLIRTLQAQAEQPDSTHEMAAVEAKTAEVAVLSARVDQLETQLAEAQHVAERVFALEDQVRFLETLEGEEDEPEGGRSVLERMVERNSTQVGAAEEAAVEAPRGRACGLESMLAEAQEVTGLKTLLASVKQHNEALMQHAQLDVLAEASLLALQGELGCLTQAHTSLMRETEELREEVGRLTAALEVAEQAEQGSEALKAQVDLLRVDLSEMRVAEVSVHAELKKLHAYKSEAEGRLSVVSQQAEAQSIRHEGALQTLAAEKAVLLSEVAQLLKAQKEQAAAPDQLGELRVKQLADAEGALETSKEQAKDAAIDWNRVKAQIQSQSKAAKSKLQTLKQTREQSGEIEQCEAEIQALGETARQGAGRWLKEKSVLDGKVKEAKGQLKRVRELIEADMV
eukprot:TRINITY_DN2326_c0_g1_i3.p1 TRINITY_DN2326_c0_g1~~TRINITY_DN2326_c0_g1_i3.p1  ORF type:complete len:814 (-),score=317.63 TRINITY_DN2326_c0_g1_i3:18-2459(-)